MSEWNFEDVQPWTEAGTEEENYDNWQNMFVEAQDYLEKWKEEGEIEETVTVLDAVFEFIEEALMEDPAQVDTLLTELKLEDLSTSVLTGIVTATSPASSLLKERKGFMEKAKATIKERDEWEEGLFDDLEGKDKPLDWASMMESADEKTRGQFTENVKRYTYEIRMKKKIGEKHHNVMKNPIIFHSDNYDLDKALAEYKQRKQLVHFDNNTYFEIKDQNEPERSSLLAVVT